LKPGGRLTISDIVLLQDLPDFIKKSIEAYVGCVSGAIKKDEYLHKIEEAGFQDIEVMDETSFPVEFIVNDPAVKAIIEKSGLPREKLKDIARSVVSIKVYGAKPAERG
jgi:hypothetical protein